MKFERLERSSVRLADFVYEQIFAAVLSGQISPGERLVQEVLADQMDVSRTPVREALLRLESEGILESSDRGGFMVRSLDVGEIRGTYELRAAVEGFAARLAAERGRPESIAHIKSAIAAADARPTTLDAGFELNRLVHRAIVEAADNPAFLDSFDSVWGRSQSFRMFAKLHETELRFLDAEPDHHAVLDAILAGDGSRAQQALTDHILSGLELQLGVLESAMAVEAGTDPV